MTSHFDLVWVEEASEIPEHVWKQLGEQNMKYKTHNELTGMGISGTFKVGNLDCPYHDLVACFGQPMDGDGYKTDAEWWIQFESGEIATIYNYKNGFAYLGNEGTETTFIDEWSIGGKSQSVVHKVKEILAELRSDPLYVPQ